MKACVVYRDKLGEPEDVCKVIDVPIPKICDDEVLVKVNKAVLPHNQVWICKGTPINVIKGEYHVGGSCGVGEVVSCGDNVTSITEGDRVVLSCIINIGKSIRIWGYETSGGCFAEYCKVKSYQCHKLPKDVDDNTACVFGNMATAYQMLLGWQPNTIKTGSNILIWGASGSIGSCATHLTKIHNGNPICVTSTTEKQNMCYDLGAVGCIDRRRHSLDTNNKKFIHEYYKIAKARPDIVFEHTGSDTISTSLLICKNNGMVVTCGATTGYHAVVDLRNVWVPQKRIQGSHYCDSKHYKKVMDILASKKFNHNLYTDVGYTLSDVGMLSSKMHRGDNIKSNNLIINIT